MKLILIRYGEIFLKGKNRHSFIAALLRNIKYITHQRGQAIQGRVIVNYFDNHRMLKRVFGATSYSVCERANKSMISIISKAVEMMRGREGTFRVVTKRSDKSFPLKSPDINRKVGEIIETETGLRFSLFNPQWTIYIEINEEGAFLFDESVECFGGLPCGVEGKVAVILENKFSDLAGAAMMRRGCFAVPMVVGEEKSNIPVPLIEKFSPRKVEICRFKRWDEADRYLTKNNIPAAVSQSRNLKIVKYSLSVPVFYPLMCEGDGYIEKLRKDYSAA